MLPGNQRTSFPPQPRSKPSRDGHRRRMGFRFREKIPNHPGDSLLCFTGLLFQKFWIQTEKAGCINIKNANWGKTFVIGIKICAASPES